MPATEPAPGTNTRRSGCAAAAWAGATVAVALIVAVVYVFYDVSRARTRRQQPVIRTQAFVQSIKREKKLVVMTADIRVSMIAEDPKVKTVWKWDVNLGTTQVAMLVPGNKVQYYVPTDEIAIDWDTDRGLLTAILPPPRLDTEFVAVQSDPNQIQVLTKAGWARLESRSGEFLEHRMKRLLRTRVLREGRSELLLQSARMHARHVVRDLLERVMEGGKERVPVRIRFTDE